MDATRLLFPYEQLAGDIVVTLGLVAVDGRKAAAAIDSPNQIVDFRAAGFTSWTDAEIELEAAVSLEALADYENSIGSIVTAFAKVFCAATNVRDSFELHRLDDGPQWKGVVRLPSSAYFGSAALTVVLTAEVDGISERVVANSSSWSLFFDEAPPSPIAGRIATRWLAFASAEEPFYARREDPYLLDVSGPAPIIYLNRDFPDLSMLLADVRRRPADAAALSEMTLLVIAQGAWMALFNAAALKIIAPDNNNRECELPAGWQGEILRSVLARLYPNKPIGESLRDIYDQVRESPELLQAEILTLTGEIINFGNKLRKHVQRLGDQGESE